MLTTKDKVLFSVIAGGLCGAFLILITIGSRNGLLMYLPYLGLAIACIVYMRRYSLTSFPNRFSVAFGSYVVATLIIFFYINRFVDARILQPLTLRNVLGPLAAMILIGAAGSAAVSLLAHPNRGASARAVGR
jgi:hypothetical protein